MKKYKRTIGIVGIVVSSLFVLLYIFLSFGLSSLGGGLNWIPFLVVLLILGVSIFLTGNWSEKLPNLGKFLAWSVAIIIFIVVVYIVFISLYLF